MATDEMGRILSLLEEGKITADEAERLLKAVETTANESKPHSAPFIADPLSTDPFRDLSAVLRTIGGKVFGQVRRQRRSAWRHCGHFGHGSERAERARTMSILERVWWVAYTGGLIARTELTADLRLNEDLGLGDFELEELEDLVDGEFNIDLPCGASVNWKTAGDVVTAVEKAIAREPEIAAEAEAGGNESGGDDGDGGDETLVGVVEPDDQPGPRKGKGAAAAPAS